MHADEAGSLSRRHALVRTLTFLGGSVAATALRPIQIASQAGPPASLLDQTLHWLVALTFEELRALVKRAREIGVLEINVDTIAVEAIGPFRAVLGDLRLQLRDLEIPDLPPGEIIVRGNHRLNRRTRLAAELRFYDQDGSISYVLTFTTPRWTELLTGELERLADALRIEQLWWTLSSLDTKLSALRTPGAFVDQGVQILRGQNYHLRFDSRLLRRLSLENVVFAFDPSSSVASFTLPEPARVPIEPIIVIEVRRITFGEGSVEVDGKLTLELLDLAISHVGKLPFEPDHLSLRFPVPEALTPPAFLFRGIQLRNCEATISGRLGSGAYDVGLAGTYTLPGSDTTGNFELKYATGGSSSVPDFVELTAPRITLSDAFSLMSSVEVHLPPAIDRVIVLTDGYLYYATRSTTNRAGQRRTAGGEARATANVLGFRGTFEIEAAEGNGNRGRALLDPLTFGDLVTISGSGPRPRRGVLPPIALEVTSDPPGGSADMRVAILGGTAADVRGTLEGDRFSFTSTLKLPGLEELQLQSALRGGELSMETRFGFTQHIVVESWIDQRKFRLKPVGVDSVLSIASAVNATPAMSAAVSVGLGVARLNVRLAVSRGELTDLKNLIALAVEKLVLDALQQPVVWLKALLEGAIEYVGKAGRLIIYATEYLIKQFGLAGEKLLDVLQRAGADLDFVLESMRWAFSTLGKEVDEAVRFLLDSGRYLEREILDAVRRHYEALVKKVGNVAWWVGFTLMRARVAVETVAKEIFAIIEDPRAVAQLINTHAHHLFDGAAQVAAQVVRGLQAIGQNVDQAGRLVANLFYGSLSAGGQIAALATSYPAREAERVVNKIVREGETAIRNGKRELEKVCRDWLGICR